MEIYRLHNWKAVYDKTTFKYRAAEMEVVVLILSSVVNDSCIRLS
jgi:hypothetical protein